MAKIRKFYEPVDFNDLIYNFKDSRIRSISYFEFKGPSHIFKKVHDDDLPLENIEKE